MNTLKNRIKDILGNCSIGHIDQIMEEIDKEQRLLINIDNVRPTVDWYAQRMEKRLKEKSATRGEDGWHDGKLAYYAMVAMKCLENIIGLFKEDNRQFPNAPIINPLSVDITLEGIGNIKEKDIHFAIKKCIDGGNFLMMLADNFRDELIKRGIR